ncbi:hypothetical protein ACOY6A_23450, partial [Enterobacter roggenkampii]|nr:hypothetical protein [Enterobacter roggenkampii]
GPDPRNFNQRVSLGRNDLLIRTFPKQSVFYMSDISIQRLETEPEKIMSECEKLQGVQKKSCAQKDMARLYKSFGEEGVLELLRNACSANDAPPSGEQKAG